MAWDRFQEYIVYYGLLFAFFTFLAFLAKGRRAFSWTSEQANSSFVNFAFIAVNTFFAFFVGLAILGIHNGLNAIGFPRISAEFWADIPWIAKAFAALLVYDFNVYWMHRFLHKGVLWPTHAVHHSDTQLHFLSWSRGHFIEHLILFSGLAIMGTWLGLTDKEIYLLGFIKGMHQYYVHSKLDWDHGVLKNWIVSPTYHRWHHADVVEAYDKNFASIFPFYDRLFGTYYCPGSAKDIPTGFDTNPGDDFVDLMMHPFKEWTRMWRERGSGASAAAIDAAE